MKRRTWFGSLLVVAACVGACSDGDDDRDAGRDASHSHDSAPGDAAPDGASDGSAVDGGDAGIDGTAPDASMDALADGTVSDGAMDGGTDGATADAAADVLPPLDVIAPPDGSVPQVCTGGDTAVDSTGYESENVSIASAGAEYAVAWQDNRDGNWEIYFARIRASDDYVMNAVRVTNDGGGDTHPSMVWDGTRYWISWARNVSAMNGDSLRIVSVTPEAGAGMGATVGTAQTISVGDIEEVHHPSLALVPATAGGGFAVAWEDGRHGTATLYDETELVDNGEIYYARLNATGARVGSEVRVTNAPRLSSRPRIAFNTVRNEVGIAWADDRDTASASRYPNEEIYFARLALDGSRPAGSTDVRVTSEPYRSMAPGLVADGAGYAIAWANQRDFSNYPVVMFAQRTHEGAMRGGAPITLSTNAMGVAAFDPALAWNGTEYLVAWEDMRHVEGDIVIRRVSAAGTVLGAETFSHDDTERSARPALTWGNGEWIMGWQDNRYMHIDVWTRRIGRSECLM